MIENYSSREQPDDPRRPEPAIGAGAIQQTKTEWGQLIAMLELAQRWQELIGGFTDDDPHPWLAASAPT